MNKPTSNVHVNCSSTYMYMPALNCCIYTYKFIVIMKSTKVRVAKLYRFPGVSRFYESNVGYLFRFLLFCPACTRAHNAIKLGVNRVRIMRSNLAMTLLSWCIINPRCACAARVTGLCVCLNGNLKGRFDQRRFKASATNKRRHCKTITLPMTHAAEPMPLYSSV